MATIWNEHGGEPVNDGERKVLRLLEEGLPNDHLLIPAIQIPVRKRRDEIDIIVIGPECLVVVEVKDLHGPVQFQQHGHVVDGERRNDVVALNYSKAQRLKSKLVDADESLRSVWVASRIVLARHPQILDVHDAVKHEVLTPDKTLERLGDPNGLIPKGFNRRLVPKDKVLAVLGLHGRPRRQSEVFGAYRTSKLLEETPEGRLYEAMEEVTKRSVLLRLHRVDPVLSNKEQSQVKERALRAYRALTKLEQRLGKIPQVAGPIGAFMSDAGDVVTVSPQEAGISLADMAEAGATLDEAIRIAVVQDVAEAIKAAHAVGVAHRRLDPSAVFVERGDGVPTGVVARVGAWDRAQAEDGKAGSLHLSANLGDDIFVAPEIVAGEVESWPAVDLWSLGRLIEWLWQELCPIGGTEPMPESLVRLVEVLTDLEFDERENATAFEVAEAAATLLAPAIGVDVEPVAESLTIDDLVPGARVGDRYWVNEVLGRGATGVVLSVNDNLLGKGFALKVFEEGVGIEDIVKEFSVLLEAGHENVVTVNDVFQVGGLTCMKMELLAGATLRDLIERSALLDIETALDWFGRVLDALAFLHDPESGPRLVHRDLKPENLIVEPEGRGLVIIDFGLASMKDRAAAGGTGRYRRPLVETGAADPDLDLFAVGIIFHEAVTGKHPFGTSGACTGVPAIDAGLPESIRQALERMLHPDAKHGFPTADRFRAALLAVVEPEPELEPELPDEEGLVLQLGPKVMLVVLPGRERRVEPETPRGEADVEVTVVEAVIGAEPGIRLDIEWCFADYGEAWVKAVDAHHSPQFIHRLVHGLRPGIHLIEGRENEAFMELRQARIVDDPDWPRLRKVSEAELDDAAGTTVAAELVALGAITVSTRERAWGDTNRRKTDLCVVFDVDNVLVPFAAYALTRVAPLALELATGGSGNIPLPPKQAVVDLHDNLWPDLVTRMSHDRGGVGDRYLDDHGYWACHDGDPWRAPRSPFGTLGSAFFGPNGAAQLLAGRGRVATRYRRWGPARVVVVRLGGVVLITDGETVAAVRWATVPVGDMEGLQALLAGAETRPFSEESF